ARAPFARSATVNIPRPGAAIRTEDIPSRRTRGADPRWHMAILVVTERGPGARTPARSDPRGLAACRPDRPPHRYNDTDSPASLATVNRSVCEPSTTQFIAAAWTMSDRIGATGTSRFEANTARTLPGRLGKACPWIETPRSGEVTCR